MFENTSELAENKLLLLFVLKLLKEPISNSQLTEIILENNLINYFTFQQYISELENSKFIKYKQKNDKQLIYLTEQGENVLSFFENRISEDKKALLAEYISQKIGLIKNELTIQSDYIPTKNESFLVDLKAFEEEDILIDIRLSVPTKKYATTLCKKWKEDYSEIYNNILNLLLKEDTKS